MRVWLMSDNEYSKSEAQLVVVKYNEELFGFF